VYPTTRYHSISKIFAEVLFQALRRYELERLAYPHMRL
jgi:hypothetical protein